MKKFKFINVTMVREKTKEGPYKGFNFTKILIGKKLKAIFGPERRQPRKDSKFITLNCFKYKVNKFIDKTK